jgi:iron(III) transport system substrate-binding protein
MHIFAPKKAQSPSQAAVLLALGILACPGCAPGNQVVLYCAHDQEFVDAVIRDFQAASGITVVTHYDSEANKSVGLIDELTREARKPRCDVHWNNEIVSTIRLQRRGVLADYASPAAAPFPPACTGPENSWHAFAARARVLLVNTKLLQERGIGEADWPVSLVDLTHPRWFGQVALSKPTAGTSATQAACLFQAWGKEKARAWYLALKANGVQMVGGNKQAAEGVGLGQYLVCITDTDDAMAEVEAGRPVRVVFPDAGATNDSGLGTLFIPNTVAIVKNCPHPEAARNLIDFLLSPKVERRLAESASRQLPLNPALQVDVPQAMAAGLKARALMVDFAQAADMWDEAQAFVRAELLK